MERQSRNKAPRRTNDDNKNDGDDNNRSPADRWTGGTSGAGPLEASYKSPAGL
jgi:hypothetical protein